MLFYYSTDWEVCYTQLELNNKKGFVFVSEMKAIFPFVDDVKPSSYFEWCLNNIFKYEATEKTLIEGIKRFPAGHYAFF